MCIRDSAITESLLLHSEIDLSNPRDWPDNNQNKMKQNGKEGEEK